MFFRHSHQPAVRLVFPRHRSRVLPEDWQPEPVTGAKPDEDEIKVCERLLALLGEVVRWPR